RGGSAPGCPTGPGARNAGPPTRWAATRSAAALKEPPPGGGRATAGPHGIGGEKGHAEEARPSRPPERGAENGTAPCYTRGRPVTTGSSAVKNDRRALGTP